MRTNSPVEAKTARHNHLTGGPPSWRATTPGPMRPGCPSSGAAQEAHPPAIRSRARPQDPNDGLARLRRSRSAPSTFANRPFGVQARSARGAATWANEVCHMPQPRTLLALRLYDLRVHIHHSKGVAAQPRRASSADNSGVSVPG